MVNRLAKELRFKKRKWVDIVIDGVNFSAVKTNASPFSKADEFKNEEFRALLNDQQSASHQERAEYSRSSRSDTRSNLKIVPKEDLNDDATTSAIPVGQNTEATSSFLGLNMMVDLNEASYNQKTASLLNSSISTGFANEIGGSTLGNFASGNSPNSGMSSLQQNSTTTQSPIVSEQGKNAQLAASGNVPNPDLTQKIASIIKSPSQALTASDMNLISQNLNKASVVSPNANSQIASTTAPNTQNTALQSGANQQASASQSAVTQGASAQFLQSAKTGNVASSNQSGKQNTIQTESIAKPSSIQTQTNPIAAPTSSSTPTAMSSTNSAAISTVLIQSQDLAQSLPDAENTEGVNLNTKENTLPSAQPNSIGPKPAELPPALRNAPPVTQQAWAGVIQRLDGKSQQFQIRLDPAELGRINVSIEITKDKKATITLAAKSSEALAELSKGYKALESALAEVGVELTEDSLKLEKSFDESSSFTFNDDDPSQKESDGSKRSKSELSNIDETPDMPRQITPEITAWSRTRVDIKA